MWWPQLYSIVTKFSHDFILPKNETLSSKTESLSLGIPDDLRLSQKLMIPSSLSNLTISSQTKIRRSPALSQARQSPNLSQIQWSASLSLSNPTISSKIETQRSPALHQTRRSLSLSQTWRSPSLTNLTVILKIFYYFFSFLKKFFIIFIVIK